MLIALTRAVSPNMAACELTHLPRVPIDLARAAAQHLAYESALRAQGIPVFRVPAAPELPDSVFIEDTAVVLPGCAVIARPGAATRRAEVSAVESLLARLRPLVRLAPPATLDGGDVLHVPGSRQLFVGISTRTNQAAVEQLRAALLGYDVRPVVVPGCLHLKSAVTLVREQSPLLLHNPGWIEAAAFPGIECLAVDPSEPGAANALRLPGACLHAAAFPRTRALLERAGIPAWPVEMDELAKAEGAVTCCSLVFEVEPSALPGLSCYTTAA